MGTTLWKMAQNDVFFLNGSTVAEIYDITTQHRTQQCHTCVHGTCVQSSCVVDRGSVIDLFVPTSVSPLKNGSAPFVRPLIAGTTTSGLQKFAEFTFATLA